ncbi:hypothetical protein EYS14_20935 [Alteromonadaceae bacterium M269]|nr:hypothetical protein EYS14_20935 [Alteromonadaceae bacterium M269]
MSRDKNNFQSDDYDEEISAIYKRASVELPVPELDTHILWQAKVAAEKKALNHEENKQNSKIQKGKKSFWLHWQWGGSVVASVLLVSLVLWVNNPEEMTLADISEESVAGAFDAATKETAEAELFNEPLAAQSALDRTGLSGKRESIENADIGLSDGALVVQETAEQVDTIESVYASESQVADIQPAVLPADNSFSSKMTKADLMADAAVAQELVSAQEAKDNLNASKMQSIADELVAANTLAESEVSESLEREQEVTAVDSIIQLEKVEKIQVTGSRIRRVEENEKEAQTPDLYLDDVKLDAEVEGLVQQTKRLQRVLYNTEIQNPEDEKRLISQLVDLQTQLSEVLVNRKQLTPEWEVLPRYLEVLTPDQQQALRAKLDLIE